jgi:hypothetical protein
LRNLKVMHLEAAGILAEKLDNKGSGKYGK